MGLFDNLGGSAGAAGQQAADAQAMADQLMKDAGYGNVTMANAPESIAEVGADRAALEAQGHEQNRILAIGTPATITIVGKTDTGEKVAGNNTYLLELKVEPEGGAAYTVKKTEIIPPQVISGYADGTSMAGRIDPEDKNKVAFGDKPFM